ncbi:hypothetical protein CRM22_008174, partial [Opisthorchis felineus]
LTEAISVECLHKCGRPLSRECFRHPSTQWTHLLSLRKLRFFWHSLVLGTRFQYCNSNFMQAKRDKERGVLITYWHGRTYIWLLSMLHFIFTNGGCPYIDGGLPACSFRTPA